MVGSLSDWQERDIQGTIIQNNSSMGQYTMSQFCKIVSLPIVFNKLLMSKLFY